MTIRQTFLEDIAEQVEDLLVEYPKAKQLFNNKAKIFKTLFDKWKLAENNLLQPYLDPSGNNSRDGYKYNRDDRMWFPVQAQKNLLPNPVLWGIEDKLCCHYVTLGIIRDMIYADEAKPVVKDILRAYAFSFASSLIEKANHKVYSDKSIKLALSQVKQDLAKTTSGGKADLPNEKPAEPGQKTTKGFMSTREIAEQYNVSYESLRKRLERYRKENALNPDAFIESQNRGRNKPKYLYKAEGILSIIEKLKNKKASVKRPTE